MFWMPCGETPPTPKTYIRPLLKSRVAPLPAAFTLSGNTISQRIPRVTVSFDLDAMRGNTAHAENIHQAVTQIQSSPVARRVHALREHHFPADTQGDGQFRAYAPLILSIPEEAFLAFLGVSAGADITLEA